MPVTKSRNIGCAIYLTLTLLWSVSFTNGKMEHCSQNENRTFYGQLNSLVDMDFCVRSQIQLHYDIKLSDVGCKYSSWFRLNSSKTGMNITSVVKQIHNNYYEYQILVHITSLQESEFNKTCTMTVYTAFDRFSNTYKDNVILSYRIEKQAATTPTSSNERKNSENDMFDMKELVIVITVSVFAFILATVIGVVVYKRKKTTSHRPKQSPAKETRAGGQTPAKDTEDKAKYDEGEDYLYSTVQKHKKDSPKKALEGKMPQGTVKDLDQGPEKQASDRFLSDEGLVYVTVDHTKDQTVQGNKGQGVQANMGQFAQDKMNQQPNPAKQIDEEQVEYFNIR